MAEPAFQPAPAIELRLRGAGGEPVDLWRTLISHGFSDLPPLAIDTDRHTLDVTLRMPRGRPRRIRVGAGTLASRRSAAARRLPPNGQRSPRARRTWAAWIRISRASMRSRPATRSC